VCETANRPHRLRAAERDRRACRDARAGFGAASRQVGVPEARGASVTEGFEDTHEMPSVVDEVEGHRFDRGVRRAAQHQGSTEAPACTP